LGLRAMEALYCFTWSMRERTVGSKGRTRDASTVAPPEAKL